MAVIDEGENVALPLQFGKPKPLPMEFWVSNFTLDELVEVCHRFAPALKKVPDHILQGLLERMYNKVKERMEKGTTDEDGSAKNIEEPIICGVCSGECKQTEERAYFNCGHYYHSSCFLPIWKTKRDCLVCGQELHCYLPVAEGEPAGW